MPLNLDELRLRQLDASLSRYKPLAEIAAPRKGWIHEIRRALHMTALQLGQRLGVTQPAIVSIEKSEAEGNINLATLRKVADALDCSLVYVLVPRSSLRDMLVGQIQKVAAQRVAHVSHSMALEEQQVSPEALNREIDELVRQMLEKPPRNLWSSSR